MRTAARIQSRLEMASIQITHYDPLEKCPRGKSHLRISEYIRNVIRALMLWRCGVVVFSTV
ncbi:MAG: hypothetical protein WCF07_10690 [Nitrososphaeraceae archaeon]